MAANDTQVVNQAIGLIGNNVPPVTGVAPTFDSSPAGKAAQTLYAPAVAAVQRWWQWDASRRLITLTTSGGTPPAGIWLYEYLYPTNGQQVWQLIPASAAVDPFNPRPVPFTVGNADIASAQKKVIWTNLQNARAMYNNNPGPSVWDPDFEQAVVYYLASQFATALGGKPTAAAGYLQAAMSLSKVAEENAN